eukprot:COSAG02_NODE_39287_length_419_cov_0.612500_1_plen_20_part_10
MVVDLLYQAASRLHDEPGGG